MPIPQRPPPLSTRTNLLPANAYAYVLRQTREPEVLAELRAATSRVPHNVMQIGADQGALMALLVRLIDAKRCIELGTYTGYSALAVALALPTDGTVIACDVSTGVDCRRPTLLAQGGS